eukprot:6139818-Alexandrium_andersonii.AAC.1
MTNLFERFFAVGCEREKFVAAFTIQKSKIEDLSNTDSLMTQSQLAKHYNLPIDHPSACAPSARTMRT